jgi:hypothetical protein
MADGAGSPAEAGPDLLPARIPAWTPDRTQEWALAEFGAAGASRATAGLMPSGWPAATSAKSIGASTVLGFGRIASRLMIARHPPIRHEGMQPQSHDAPARKW